MRAPSLVRLAVAAAALPCACETAPEPPPPPPFEVVSGHYSGTVRTGPVSDEGPVEGPLWVARLSAATVPSPPTGAYEPISSLARHVFVERGAANFRARGELALGTRLAADEVAAGDAVPANAGWSFTLAEALPSGATLMWTATPNSASENPPAPPWERLTVQLSRDADALEAALVFEGTVVPRAENDQGIAVPAAYSIEQREHVVLELAPETDGTPWRLFVPAPSAAEPEGGLLLELSVTAAPADEPLAELEQRAHRNLERARESARARSSALTVSESFEFESRSALNALERRRLQRPALVFLAQQTGAAVTGELALSTDEASLGDYLAAVRERLHRGDVPTNEPRALGWFLDSTALLWMAERAQHPEHELAPELVALLLVHTGELGRYPDLVQEAVLESASLGGLGERLVRENRIFLEDGHPTARLRANEWLAARGQAPAGFDPLASLADRRAALEAAQTEEQGE